MTSPGGTRGRAVRIPQAKVALSTMAAYPDSVAAAFQLAAQTGYDGLEVMVWKDAVSQDVDALLRLRDQFGIPVLAVHAPCLVLTRRVWGTQPWGKLDRAAEAALKLGADTVVVHPPFRWQRHYARDFQTGLVRLAEETGLRFAVENMFPLRVRGRAVSAYAPDWCPRNEDYRHFTLDTSHTSVSGTDPLGLLDDMADRLAHVHIADGTGLPTDEHLVPGRGTQPCAAVLERLAERAFAGTVVVEIGTGRARNRAEREADIVEALAYTRLHLAAPARPGSGSGRR